MKNLDQIRAKNAIAIKIGKGQDGGEAVHKKVPAMIMENGILGALAFAIDKGPGGYQDVFNGIVAHLTELKMLPASAVSSLEGLLNYLCSINAMQLRSLTSETMTYLSYLRRFG